MEYADFFKDIMNTVSFLFLVKRKNFGVEVVFKITFEVDPAFVSKMSMNFCLISALRFLQTYF